MKMLSLNNIAKVKRETMQERDAPTSFFSEKHNNVEKNKSTVSVICILVLLIYLQDLYGRLFHIMILGSSQQYSRMAHLKQFMNKTSNMEGNLNYHVS